MLICNRRYVVALVPARIESMLGCARAIACSPDAHSNDALSTHMQLHCTKCIYHKSRCNASTLSTVLHNTKPSALTAVERRHEIARSC